MFSQKKYSCVKFGIKVLLYYFERIEFAIVVVNCCQISTL